MNAIVAILEVVSARSVLVALGCYLVIRTFLTRIDEARRVRRLGKTGTQAKFHLPWALDKGYLLIRSIKQQKIIEFFRDRVFEGTDQWTVESHGLGSREVVTMDPENIKAVLATQFEDFGKTETFHTDWEPFLGDSIFATDGEKWQSGRKLFRPQFTRQRVSDLDCFERHSQVLLRALANGVCAENENDFVDMSKADGKKIEIYSLLLRHAFDITADFLLGDNINSLCEPKQAFAEAFDEVQRVQTLIGYIPGMAKYIYKPTYWAGVYAMNDYLSKYIDQALRLSPEELQANDKADKGYSFLHAIAGFTRDRKLLRDHLVAVMLAGRDTTAATLSWCLYELARHPEAVTKLRQEILETLGSDESARPTYENLKNMAYLKAVVNETLRLYPVVPINSRAAFKDTTLPRGGGPDGSEPLAVLKDTRIIYSPYIMQHRQDIYPPVSDTFADPEVFSPERWMNWFPKPHDYIPFNSGPRICVGQQFALTQMTYTLCRLFQTFESIESHMFELDGGKPAIQCDITARPLHGVHVSFHLPKKQ